MRVYTLKDFFCETCSLQFDKKAVYDIHLSFVHKIEILVKEETEDLKQENNQKSHKCSICDNSFSRKFNLKKHIETVHDGKKPHKCSVCDYSCSRNARLKKHIEIVHERKKPHKCSICDISFSRSEILKQHIISS